MTVVTIDLTTLLVATATIGAGAVAWSVRQAREQTQMKERINWLCARYANDHDTTVPWEEPIADGGYPVESEPDGDATAPHHFYVGVAVATFGFASIWEYYPVTGASMAGLGLLIAADDFVSHAFGVPTPLDLIWKKAIIPLMDRWER